MPEELEPREETRLVTRNPEPLPVAEPEACDGYTMSLLKKGGIEPNLQVHQEERDETKGFVAQFVRKTKEDVYTGFRRPHAGMYLHVVSQKDPEEVEVSVEEEDPRDLPNEKDLFPIKQVTDILHDENRSSKLRIAFALGLSRLCADYAQQLESEQK